MLTAFYDLQVWYGIVEKYCEEFDDYTVNFLHQSWSSGSSAYHLPSNKDSCPVPGHHILTVMSCPTLSGGSRQICFCTEKKLMKLSKVPKNGVNIS